MRGRKSPLVVHLTDEEQDELTRWLRTTTMPAGKVRRARAVLLVSEGRTLAETARLVGYTRKIVRRWVSRFLAERLKGLNDKDGRGGKPVFPPRSSRPSRETRM